MRFHGLDLNLLVALDALLDTASVSRAAERLNLSQAATSNALARLREALGDDLLRRDGRALVLTDRARRLKEDLPQVLAQIHDRLLSPPGDGPARGPAHVTIMAPDALATEFLSAAAAHLARIAPQTRLTIRPAIDKPQTHLERGLVDLLVIPRQFAAPGHPSRALHEEPFVIVTARGSRWDKGVSAKDYLAADHVTVLIGPERKMPIDHAIIEQAHGPLNSAVTVSSQSQMPWYLIGTDRIGTLPARLARRFADHLPLRLHPLPFAVAANTIVVQWNRRRDHDHGLQWIVEQLAQTPEPNHLSLS
ncbi:LysR family transcriptional regulator [Pseudooceanicola sp. CBS1P-1]|uniref:LysR family transcriptional regulator n=1 Tax=Pseudooceanicola albus TaxID=2692189 RepID=A0A6L7FWL6_9RHOB|nr:MULTISPECIES: LysR family transcriptional regulator [Pseudooceanicola]MBT9383417.1 LysR family transcriptional regulator [Pseudooceanicola endophyticus]MXN16261.1 LysR family transcriptional regulator [Pseudooceanicola albus]